jgi:outer membrane immunogenic protein
MQMKALLLSSTFLVIGSATAMAAPPSVPSAPQVASAFSWTGCYVGAHVGGSQVRTSAATNFEGTGSTGDSGTGTIAGGQAGCNYQAGNWVFGVESEGSWSNSSASNFLNVSFPFGNDTISLTTRNNSDFSIAGRAGVAFDRTLIYAKGGWVWGSFTYNSTLNCCSSLPTLTSGNLDLSGFLVGAGIEHALTRNWTLRVEYNYLGFGSKLLTVGTTVNTGIVPVTVTESAANQIFKIGVSYLFDFGRTPGAPY